MDDLVTPAGNVAPGVGSLDIRPLMAEFPTGVAIVTAHDEDGRPWGMTCTAVFSVSLVPPIVGISLRMGSPTLRAVRITNAFALNLVHSAGRDAAVLFGSGEPQRFDLAGWEAPSGSCGPHLVESAHMIADCSLVDHKNVGDHSVLFGEVSRFERRSLRMPLLYGRRGYASWPGEK